MKKLKIGIIVADIDEYRPFEEVIEKGEYEMNSAIKLVQNLSYYNTAKMVGEPK